MENQHRKISGYRELSQEEIDLMNRIKDEGRKLEELLSQVNEHLNHQDKNAIAEFEDDECSCEVDRLRKAEPRRWMAIARTHLQEGLMALTRAVAQPTTF